MSTASGVRSRGGWLGLVLFGTVLSLIPGWQSPGTGQSPPHDTQQPPAGSVGLPQAGMPAGMIGGGPAIGIGPAAAAVPPQLSKMGNLPLAGGASAGDCLGFARPAGDGGQIITLINTSREWMAVYHVDGSGHINLIGSRPLTQDFAVQFNAVAPLPEDIRRIAGP